MTMDTREPSRVNTVIRDDLFTSVFLPVGPLREELRLKISTRWIERLTGRPASAYLQKRGRDGALDLISETEGFFSPPAEWFHASPIVQANSALILFDALSGRVMHEGGLV
jgi:hypothetical protein